LQDGTIPRGEKDRIMNEAVEWIRNDNSNPQTLDEPTVVALANIAELPLPDIHIPKDQKSRKATEILN
jgi:hypothetical protein